MKKSILMMLLPALAIVIFIAAQQPVQGPKSIAEDIELGWPDEVMLVFKRSCFDCHTAESGNIKGKSKLNFSKWENYKLTKKIGKLSNIAEDVKENNMPPKKYLNDYPDRALSDEEVKLIVEYGTKNEP